ncbi:MAG: tRNA dihydrouridine(20/20a) synthase DusA [Gammaproteobacteria bacterium]
MKRATPLRLSVAPMMDWTDKHCRYFHRLLAPDALLYTEMVHSAAVVHGDRDRLLDNSSVTGPVALQLGGSDPAQMAEAAAIGEQYGYAQININVGCPSDRVQSGQFGACLMARPAVVAQCVREMRARVSVPITVKSRIGIDEQDSEEFLRDFVDQVADAGCSHFIIHARIAILAGLSPKQNREIPPLNYPRVHRLALQRPDLDIEINGGFRDVESVTEQAGHVDGVMIGRAAYQTPYLLASLQQALRPGESPESGFPTRSDVMEDVIAYAAQQRAAGIPLRAVARHTLGLFQGLPGARHFRRAMSEGMHQPDADVDVIWSALGELESQTA